MFEITIPAARGCASDVPARWLIPTTPLMPSLLSFSSSFESAYHRESLTTSRNIINNMTPRRPARRLDFEIAIICALRIEADAVRELFDRHWEDDGPPYDKASGDPNAYSTGLVGRHNVVLAHMPGMGKANVAAMASSCRVSFPNIRLALVVGVCGAVPIVPNTKNEIVLGDVIVSTGVIQYDFGRQLPERFMQKDTLLESLGRPNREIRALLVKLGGIHERKKLRDKLAGHLEELQKESELEAEYPGIANDRLFDATYRHIEDGKTCEECGCNGQLVRRRRLDQSIPQPVVHFGLIASGDTVMKDGEERDSIARQEGVIGFEMEGAEIWDTFSCIVIKGACDYADSHMAKGWQRYAAATAAACTKAFLEYWVPTDNVDPAGADPNWETSSVASIGSSSTLVGSTASGPVQSGLQQAVSFLLDNEILYRLFQTAVQRPDIGVDRFCRNLTRVLKRFGIELTQEADSADENTAATFFQKYRLSIAFVVSKRVAEMNPEPIIDDQPNKPERDLPESTVSDNEDEGEGEGGGEGEGEGEGGDKYEDGSTSKQMADEDVSFDSIKPFILSSNAFQQMLRGLSDFVHPSFCSHARKLVEEVLRDKDVENDRYWTDMELKLRVILTELEESRPQQIMLDVESTISRLDQFMAGIESITGEKWNWWPLAPPKYPLGPSEVRIRWRCVGVFPSIAYGHQLRC